MTLKKAFGTEHSQITGRDNLCSAFCVLCFLFIFTGCASTDDVGRLQWQLNNLQSQVNDIESQIPGGVRQLSKSLKGTEEEQKATSAAVSDLFLKVQSLTTELQILTGRFEEARYFSEKTSEDLTESKDSLIAQIKELEVSINDLKRRIASIEREKTLVEKQKPARDIKKTKEKELPEAPAKKAKDVYMEAYKLFKEERFGEARERFLGILENYPENEYSDNARFWIGESYYRGKNYEDAILAYEELLKKNPTSDKVSGALLKQGLAFFELNDKKTGKIILEKLIEKFPDSEQAKHAKKKLSPPTPPKKK